MVAAPVAAPVVAVVLPPPAVCVAFAPPDGVPTVLGMMVSVKEAELAATLTLTADEDDDDPVTAPVEPVVLSVSGHSVVVDVVPTTTVSVPLPEPVMAPVEDPAEAGEDEEDEEDNEELVSLSVHVADVDVPEAADEDAVDVGVHSSAGRVKVPLE